MLFKNKKIIIIAATVVMCIIAVTASYFIYDINKRFPEPAETYTYSYDSPADEDGLIITPMECKLYDYKDYEELYNYSGASSGFEQGIDSDKIRALVFKIQYENITSSDITYRTTDFSMVAKNSGAFNGALTEGGVYKYTIKPGEKQIVTLSTVIVEGSITKKKWMNKLNSDTYYLVYWWYPYVKRLGFDVNHG